MSPTTPDPDFVDRYGRTAAIVTGIVTFVWGVIRFILRPFLDAVIFEAWKRKATDAEKFMRDGMFAALIRESDESRRLIGEAAHVAASNAQSITSLTAQVSQCHSDNQHMRTLLAGIPQLAASIETIADDVRDLARQARANGEALAAHGALLGERRHGGRRSSDPADGHAP